MKNLITLIASLVLTLGIYAQDYWATYLPETSAWDNYYEALDGNIYHMDTTGGMPTVYRIDPSGTDPGTYIGMDEVFDLWDMSNIISPNIPDNTIILWKCGTSDTLTDETKNHRMNFVSGARVYLGSYGTGAKPKLYTNKTDDTGYDVHFALGDLNSLWVNNLEFAGDTLTNPFLHGANALQWHYYYGWGNVFMGKPVADGSKLMWTNTIMSGVTQPLNAQTYIKSTLSSSTSLDTLVIYNHHSEKVLREGLEGDIKQIRAYSSDLGDFNHDFTFTGEGGGDLQLTFGAVGYRGQSGLHVWKNCQLDRSRTANKHLYHYTQPQGDLNQWEPVNTTVVFDGCTMAPPYDTAACATPYCSDGSNLSSPNMIDSIYFVNCIFREGDNPEIDGEYKYAGPNGTLGARRYIHIEGCAWYLTADMALGANYGTGYQGGVTTSGNRHIVFINNTVFPRARHPEHGVLPYGISVSEPASGMSQSLDFRNNIIGTYDTDNIFNTAGVTPTMTSSLTKVKDYADWDSYFGITDWDNEDYTPTANGASHDNGTSVPLLNKYSGALTNLYDLNGNQRNQGNSVDIGALEYPEGGQSNLVPIIEAQDFWLDENSPNSYLVGTVEASDPDPGQTLTFSIQGGNTGGAFFIDSDDGDLYVANSSMINYEETDAFSLIIKVQDNGAGSLSAQATITVNLNDVNEIPEIENQSFVIEQTIANGELVGMIEATDPDLGQVLSFSITAGNGDGAFQIDAGTGELTVADNSLFDISVTPEYSLTVMVEDNGADPLTEDATITVTLEEVNFAPTIDDQDFNIDENLGVGLEVGIVAASDPNVGQTIAFSILSGNTDGAFEIASGTGRLSVVNDEAINYEVNPQFTLVIQVEDDGVGNLTDEANIAITLNDVNEPPVMEDQNYVVEESIANGELVGYVDAEDPDQGQTLTFSITGGNADGGFALNSSTGELTVADNSVLNFITTPIYFLDVEVEDDGAGSLTDAAVIAVSTDEVNQAPVIEDQSFSLEENSPSATLVGNVVAMDPDAGQSLTYSIVSGNALGAFQIDEMIGALSINTASVINFEENPSFALVIKVEDDGIGNLSDEAMVNVNLIDVNEAPVVESSSFNLEENSAVGMAVGVVDAEDPDYGQSLTYAIISGNIYGAFSIDEANGTLTINNQDAVNFEATEVFYLVIEVEDNGTGNLSDQGVVTINIEDINETPEIEDQYFSVEENSVAGTEVGEVIAFDPDNGQSLTYFITSGNIQDAFTIDPANGMITVQNQAALDITVNPIFILDVEVVDNGSGNLSDQASVVIALMGATSVYEATGADFDCDIYPNPARDNVNLVVKNMKANDLNVKVIDFMGKIVFEQDYSSPDKQFETKINLETCSEGLYIIFLSNGDILEKIKMIKQ